MADNPILEPDLFYGTTKAEESEEGQPEVEAVTSEEPVADEDPNTAKETETEEVEESEESESENDDETDDGEEELLYLDLDGEEVDLETIKKWRDGHLMQADYTRKTQELAQQRKEAESTLKEAADLKAKLNDIGAELEVLIEEVTPEKLAELRDYDPEEYIKQKELLDKRKSAVEKIKSTQVTLSPEEIKAEQDKLFAANPSWFDDKGKPTKQMEEDAALLNQYWSENGFSNEEIQGMVKARYVETSLKAAKYDALKAKTKETAKRTKKAALVTKPKKQAKPVTKPKKIEDVFYGT